MFGIKRRKNRNLEVEAAMAERDEVLEDLDRAIEKVDRIQNETISEYEQVNGLRRREVGEGG